MLTTKKNEKTCFIANWYRESEDFSTLVNYRILRAGHIRTAKEYVVHRQSVVGHELIFCLSGKGYIYIDGQQHQVTSGQLAWLPVRWPHQHHPDADDPWEVVWIRIEGAKLNNIMQILDIRQQPVFEFQTPKTILEIYNHIFALMDGHNLMNDARCDVLCAQLIYQLLENRSLEASRTPVIMHRGLGQLVYQIHSHYSDDWDIEKFMACCQVSKSQLFRLFNATFGQSPLKWLKNYRLFQARRLLVETNETIGRIASQVGYSDPLHFSRDFHKSIGISPSEFRRREQFDSDHK